MDRSSCAASRHGTYSAYRATPGCRCDDACEDEFRYSKDQRSGHLAPRRVPALGYSRQIRALQAAAWPLDDLARRGGVGWSTLGHIGSMDVARIRLSTAQKVANLWSDLRNLEGPSTFERYGVRSAEWRAWAAGYPPPGAWAGRDIHDPQAQPDWIRAGDPDEVAAEQVACGQRRWTDLRNEEERALANQLAVRSGVSQRSRQKDWKVSSRVITRLDRLNGLERTA